MADTIIYPRAMVVQVVHALCTKKAVLGIFWRHVLAVLAKSKIVVRFPVPAFVPVGMRVNGGHRDALGIIINDIENKKNPHTCRNTVHWGQNSCPHRKDQ